MPTPLGATTRLSVPLALVLAVAGAVLLWLGLSPAPQTPAEELAPLAQDGTVEVGEDGFSLWSDDPEAYQDAWCVADATPLLRPTGPWSLASGDRELHEVARSPRALPPGTYAVSCTPEQALVVGPHAELTAGWLLRGQVGVVAGAVALLLALVLTVVAVIATVRRRRLESWRVPPHRLQG